MRPTTPARALLALVAGTLLSDPGTFVRAGSADVAHAQSPESVPPLSASTVVALAPYVVFDGSQDLGVSSFAVSRDGAQAAAGWSGGITFWDTATGTKQDEVRLGTDDLPESVFLLDYSPASHRVAAISTAGTADHPAPWQLRLIDGDTGSTASAFQESGLAGGTSSVPPQRVAFSPDGHTLAVWYNWWVYFFDGATATLITQWRGGAGSPGPLVFTPDGSALVMWWQDTGQAEIAFWDVATGRRLRTVPNGPGEFLEACFSQNGRLFASGNISPNAIRVWDTTTWQPIQTLSVDGFLIRPYCSPDGSLLAYTQSERARVVDPASGRLLWQAPAGPTITYGFSPDGKSIILSDPDGSLQLWSAEKAG